MPISAAQVGVAARLLSITGGVETDLQNDAFKLIYSEQQQPVSGRVTPPAGSVKSVAGLQLVRYLPVITQQSAGTCAN